MLAESKIDLYQQLNDCLLRQHIANKHLLMLNAKRKTEDRGIVYVHQNGAEWNSESKIDFRDLKNKSFLQGPNVSHFY